MGRRTLYRLLLAVTCAGFLGVGMRTPMLLAAGPSPVPKEIQNLYEKKDYQKAVEEIAKLEPEKSAEPDVRRLKIRSLLKLGNPKGALVEYDKLESALKQDDIPLLHEVAMGFIVVMMKDMREQMRGAAYTSLKDLDSSEAIPFLEDGLSDGSGLVRALAAEGLAKLEEGRRSARFKKALNDEAVLVREAVLKGLGKSNDAAVVALVEPILKDSEVRVRVAAAEALCRLGRNDGCDLLMQSGKAPNPDERTSAIRALVDLQRPQVLQILIEASEHKQPSVRGAAATGFAHVAKQEALPALARLLKDPLPPVRISAAVSLGHQRGKDAVLILRSAVEDHDASVKAFVIGALLEQDERYELLASSISNLCNSKDPAVRAANARALGHASGPNQEPVRSALVGLARDSVPRVRIAAFKSFAKLEGTDILPLLKQGIHDEDDAVRSIVGGALVHFLADKSQRK